MRYRATGVVGDYTLQKYTSWVLEIEGDGITPLLTANIKKKVTILYKDVPNIFITIQTIKLIN